MSDPRPVSLLAGLTVTGSINAATLVTSGLALLASAQIPGAVTMGTSLIVTGPVTGTSFSGSGSSLTGLNASNLGSGTVPIARLGSSGTASATTFLAGNNSWTSAVTAVTVVAANGVSATVANQGTTPAITLSLGAITPTSVAASTSVSAPNLVGALVGTGSYAPTLTTGVFAGVNAAQPSIPQFGLIATAAPANARASSFYVAGNGTLNWTLLLDDLSNNASFMTVARSGTTATNITFTGSAITLSGAVSASSLTTAGNVGASTISTSGQASLNSVVVAGSASVGGSFSVTGSASFGTLSSSVVALTTSSVDCSKGNYFTRTNSAASTWTFTNAPSGFYRFTLRLIRAAGAGSQTWPSSVRWSGGTAPTLTGTNGGSDIFEFLTDNAGATWRAYRIIQTTS